VSAKDLRNHIDRIRSTDAKASVDVDWADFPKLFDLDPDDPAGLQVIYDCAEHARDILIIQRGQYIRFQKR
jgi:hypothetical protein